MGIPQALRERLFEAFEQADGGLARRHGGTGLGTTIAKGLAEAMGGSIGFESVEQQGSNFWVEVPFEAGKPKVVAPAPLQSHEEGCLLYTSPGCTLPGAGGFEGGRR